MTNRGMRPAEIAAQLGCNVRTVARVKKANRQQEAA
ncbi:helix-turn-helix domain-containing protein [Streptomyces sp. NPDC058409]